VGKRIQSTKQGMPILAYIQFAIISGILFLLLAVGVSMAKRKEIMENWPKYQHDPFIMMTAFLYKPDTDPRSRFEFADDNFRAYMKQVVRQSFSTSVSPLFSVFDVLQGTVNSTIGGSDMIRRITEEMQDVWKGMTGIFMKRFEGTLHQMKMTYFRLHTAMQRTWAVGINSLYQSFAIVNSLFSTMDLMFKIVLIILGILLGILFLLFLFMWPFVPVILSVVGILTTAGMGGAVGGMAAAFCFEGHTPVEKADGTMAFIDTIQIGDVLADGGRVTATFAFEHPTTDLYEVEGIRVTGSHIFYKEDGTPCLVRDCPSAVPILTEGPVRLYCLTTTTHKLPIRTTKSRMWFADWEEISEENREAQLRWNREVFETLNPGFVWTEEGANIQGEAVVHSATFVRLPRGGRAEIGSLYPGAIVLDADGTPTKVVGVVAVDVGSVGTVDKATATAAWTRSSQRNPWRQAAVTGTPPMQTCELQHTSEYPVRQGEPDTVNAMQSQDWMRDQTLRGGNYVATHKSAPMSLRPWRSLFTEAGSFLLDSGVGMRDFSDIGLSHISKTISWILEVLK
jgi:hypothetical protein